MAVIELGALADVPEGGAKVFELEGNPVAIFRVEGELFAIDDTCTHQEYSLAEGEVDADELCVECPAHGALFDLRSGRARTLPAFKPVNTYKVWAEGDLLFVDYSK